MLLLCSILQINASNYQEQFKDLYFWVTILDIPSIPPNFKYETQLPTKSTANSLVKEIEEKFNLINVKLFNSDNGYPIDPEISAPHLKSMFKDGHITLNCQGLEKIHGPISIIRRIILTIAEIMQKQDGILI